MNKLKEVYEKLLGHFGPQYWWPAQTSFEVIVGAILTQNTNWVNVQKAIQNMKAAGILSPQGLAHVDIRELARLIKPAGYYNVKSRRLKNFIKWLMEAYQGDLTQMFRETISTLREQLLSIQGIGPETADSIILYAAEKPSFVVDAYTYRILTRHNLISQEATYDEIKSFFEDHLPGDVKLFNEFHALLVRLGKEYCKKTNPLCEKCPLLNFA